MIERTIKYQKLCGDLLDAMGTAGYFLEVKNDPSGAAAVLKAARDKAVEDYLAACGPVYHGAADTES